MYRNAFASIALAGLLLPFSASADITTGLVGYWPFNNGPGAHVLPDNSGNGNTATLTNFSDLTYNDVWTNSTDPMNQWPYALLFNQPGEGTNTYAKVSDSLSLDLPTTTRQWTLAAWVNCSVDGSLEPPNAGIICKGNLNAEAYGLYMSGGSFVGIFHNGAGTGTETATSVTVPAAGTWYHVALTVLENKGSATAEAILYVNGVRESGANSANYTTMFASSQPVTIGCRAGSTGAITNAFQGTLDEVRIYDRALTASDIAQLYNNQAVTIANNGVGYWNGTAGSGGNATLDNTSLNYCTNLWTSPLGTASSLTNLLAVENSAGEGPVAFFSDSYYTNGVAAAVTSTNLAIAAGGIALGTANNGGTLTFQNQALTYFLHSTDTNGIADGANPTYLQVIGGGTVILTGTNSFSGGATITSGTLELGNGGATGAPLGSGEVTDNSTLAFGGDDNVTVTNTINGTGGVTVEGSGTVTLSGGNTYSGVNTLTSGTLNVNVIADFGSSSIGSGSVTLNGGTLAYTGVGESTPREFDGISGATSTIDVTNGVSLELTGRVRGRSTAFTINKTDTGTLILSGAGDNTDLGMNVLGGTLVLNKTGGHAIGEPLTVASNATVQLNGNGYSMEIYSNVDTPVTIYNGGVLDMNGDNNALSAIYLSGAGIGGNGALINSASNTSSSLTAPTILGANTAIGGPGDITLLDGITGNGMSLAYVGSGILSLEGTNDYSGGTEVSSGTLDVGATGFIAGNLTVSGSGTLEFDNATPMPPSAILTLPNAPAAGIVDLNYSGAMIVDALVIGGAPVPPGTYDAVINNPDGVITGPGFLTVVTVPVVTNVSLVGSTLLFSGTNGPDNGLFYVLSSTNLALPLSDWTISATNYFSSTGTFNATNAVGSDPAIFWSIKIP